MCTCRAPIKSSAKLLKDKNRNWRLLTLDGSALTGSHQRWRCVDVPLSAVQFIFHICCSGPYKLLVCALVSSFCPRAPTLFVFLKGFSFVTQNEKKVDQLSQCCSSKVPVRKGKKTVSWNIKPAELSRFNLSHREAGIIFLSFRLRLCVNSGVIQVSWAFGSQIVWLHNVKNMLCPYVTSNH